MIYFYNSHYTLKYSINYCTLKLREASKNHDLQKLLNRYSLTTYTIVKSVKLSIKWYIFLLYKKFLRGHPILRLVSTALLIFHEDLFLKDHLP